MVDTAASRRKRRPSTSDGRLAELINSAAEVFERMGYSNTRIQDVADAVGMLKGSLYYYIETKEDLLFAIVQEVHDMALDLLARTKDVRGGAAAQFRYFIEEHIRISIEHQVKINVSLREFGALSPDRRRAIRNDREAFSRYMTDLVVAGQAEGTFDPNLDPTIAAYGVMGMLNWTSTWYRQQGGTTPERLAATFESLVLSGLETRSQEHWPPARRSVQPRRN